MDKKVFVNRNRSNLRCVAKKKSGQKHFRSWQFCILDSFMTRISGQQPLTLLSRLSPVRSTQKYRFQLITFSRWFSILKFQQLIGFSMWSMIWQCRAKSESIVQLRKYPISLFKALLFQFNHDKSFLFSHFFLIANSFARIENWSVTHEILFCEISAKLRARSNLP